MSKRVGVMAGILSVLTLAVNWIFMIFMSTRYDPGAVHVWEPFGSHPIASFGVLMVVGICSGIYAGIKGSRIWIAFAGLNLVSYVLELCAS